MYLTRHLYFTNGMDGSDSATLYITIHKGSNVWCLFIAYESNSDSQSAATTGLTVNVPSGSAEARYWCDITKAAIWNMLAPTTVEDDGFEHDGGWSDIIEDAQFDPNEWIDYPN